MGKNSKPILSVLVDEDKKEKFAELARRYKYSMGWILNDCIDRMLDADSINIYRTPTGTIEERPNFTPEGVNRGDVEELINTSTGKMKAYIEEISKNSVGSATIGLDPGSIENAVHQALVSLDVPSRGEFETIDSRITTALTPLQAEISEVAKFSRNLQGEIVKIKKPLALA